MPHIWPTNFDCITGELFPVSPCYMGDYVSLTNFDPAASETQGGFLHGWGDNSLKFHDPDDNLDVPDPDIRTFAGC